MLLNQITVFVHYLITNYSTTIYIILLQELFSSLSFISICFLFCRNSSKLLPNRKQYLKLLKIIGLISLVFYFLVFILQLTGNITSGSDVFDSCKTPLYVAFSIIQLPISLMFIVAGFVINKVIKKYQPITEYEKFMHSIQRKRSMR